MSESLLRSPSSRMLESTAPASVYTSSSEGSVTAATSTSSSASSHSQLSLDAPTATLDGTPSSNAPTSTSSSSSGEAATHGLATTKPKKKKKKKKKNSGGTDDAADNAQNERRRVEWNNYQEAVAILEGNLVSYQKLNPKTQQKDRSALKEKVADKILADVELKKAFERDGHSHEEIRRVRA